MAQPSPREARGWLPLIFFTLFTMKRLTLKQWKRNQDQARLERFLHDVVRVKLHPASASPRSKFFERRPVGRHVGYETFKNDKGTKRFVRSVIDWSYTNG